MFQSQLHRCFRHMASAVRGSATSLPAPVLAALLAVVLVPSHADALVITELMSSNATTVTDEDGDYSDWVELFNNSASTANLAGMHLTDDELAPTKWQFPAVTLGAGQYLIVWASDKNRTTAGLPLHANFKLSSSGEYLGLIAADGVTVVDEYLPSFPALSPDRSYGLASDLVTERCFILPTPGALNNESADCVTTAPVTFSPEHGYYDAPIAVTLSSSTPGATIHYTLDGSDPTETHGSVYSAPISVTTNAMVRAMAFGPGLTPTPSVTHTYIYLDDILTQSIADQPPEYLFYGADYDMDPNVVNNPRYSSEIKDDLKAAPALSIVTDVDHLFGPVNGIYTHRTGTGVAWERPTSVEMIHASGAPGFQINCGIRIQGGVSRLSSIGKYSLRLLFKGIYGPSKLVYPFFPGSPVDSFDTITLTATHGNSWAAGFSRSEYIRDTWLKDTQLAMGQASAHTTYVHLFLNGRYWGMYRPTERPSAPFLASYYGGIEEDYDALNAGKVINGDRIAWDTLQDLAAGPVETLAGYNAVLEYLDVENFIDYMITNIYAANYDWPDKNWYAGRRREAGAGFRFFNWDGEDTFASINANRTNIGAIDTPGAIYANLRGSAEFRLTFGDRVHKHFFNGGALTPGPAAERWRKRRDQIYGAVVGESARWGDHRRELAYTRDIEWIAENQRFLLALFPARTRIQIDQFRDAGLYPKVVAPEFSQHGGTFFPGATVALSAPAGVIYVTTDGSDPRVQGGAVAASASVYSSPLVLTTGVTIKARVLSGSDWSALSDADFSPASPLRITELMYNPSAGVGAEYLEIRNIGSTTANLAGVRLTQGVTFTFPATTLAPGATAVVVENTTTFQTVYGPGHTVLGQYSGRQDNGGERIALVAADNSTIHDFEYDDAWYPTTDGPGRSLVIRDANGDLSLWGLAAGWRASAMNGGTPASVEPPHCANGIDDDGDGLTDLTDPGCASAASDTEVTECNDGIDNDTDGNVDLADLQCTSASHATETPDAGDSFLCYGAKAPSSQPFEPTGITIDDELDGAVSYDVPTSQAICVAGARDGVSAIDATTHLRAYPLQAVDGEPLHVPVLGVHYDSDFGPFYIDIGKPLRLLAPAKTDPLAPVAPPVFASHGVDFYKCYRASLSRSLPRYFPTQAQMHFEDPFETRDYVLRPPTQVCTPASFDGAPVKTPGRHMLCFKAVRNRYSATHVPLANVNTADVFGQTTFTTSRESDVCVPAVQVAD